MRNQTLRIMVYTIFSSTLNCNLHIYMYILCKKIQMPKFVTK